MKTNSYFGVLTTARLRATGQPVHIEARQSGVYRIKIPGGSERLVNHRQLGPYIPRKDDVK